MYKDVPHYILDHLKGEPVDFIVQSKHNYTKKASGLIFLVVSLGFSWLLIFPIVFSYPLIELMVTGSTEITVNGTLETYTPTNFWVPLFFALIPTIFVLPLLVPLFLLFKKGFSYLTKKGQWYAGTNTALFEFDGASIDYYPWNTFASTIKTKVRKDNSLDIILSYKNPPPIDIETNTSANPSNINITINGEQVHLSRLNQHHNMFRNKIGLLGIQNGTLVLNMIRTNMKRSNEK